MATLLPPFGKNHLSNWIKLIYIFESLIICVYFIGILTFVFMFLRDPEPSIIAVSAYLLLLISYAVWGHYKHVFRQQKSGFWMKFAAHIGLSILLFAVLLCESPDEGPCEPDFEPDSKSEDSLLLGLISCIFGINYSVAVMGIYLLILNLKLNGNRTWWNMKEENGYYGMTSQLIVTCIFAVISFYIVIQIE